MVPKYMGYSKDKLDTYFPSFTQIFNEFDDESLIQLALYNPSALHKMCIFLSVDLQLEKEHQLLIKKGN